MNSGVYIIVNTKTGMIYIGSSYHLRSRWQTHKWQLGVGKHENLRLQDDWIKYGEQAFKFYVLEYCHWGNRYQRESHFIKIYRAKDMLYNVPPRTKQVRNGKQVDYVSLIKETTR